MHKQDEKIMSGFLSEEDTKRRIIDPAIGAAGWSANQIMSEYNLRADRFCIVPDQNKTYKANYCEAAGERLEGLEDLAFHERLEEYLAACAPLRVRDELHGELPCVEYAVSDLGKALDVACLRVVAGRRGRKRLGERGEGGPELIEPCRLDARDAAHVVDALC